MPAEGCAQAHGCPRRGPRGALACAALAGAIGLGACSSPPEPRFEVKGVTLIEETEHGYVLDFNVEGENRGPDPLPLRTVNYSLSLDGREVFHGSRSAQVTLRRFGNHAITLPVAVRLAPPDGMPDGRVPYRFEASVEYEVPGSIAEILFDSDIRRPSVAFSESGRLDFESIKAGAPGPTEASPRGSSAEPTP